MSDDWQPGDLALCIKLGVWRKPKTGEPSSGNIKAGSIHTVVRVGNDGGWHWIAFGPKGSGRYHSDRFRKIRPHERDAEDEETIRLLNAAKVYSGAGA